MQKTLIRPPKTEDVAFIASTWLNNFKNSSKFGQNIKKGIFYDNHAKIVNRILSKTNHVYIAHLPDDEDTIIGYMVGDAIDDTCNVIHFIYVKQPFRNFGVMKELLIHSEIDLSTALYTHETYVGADIIKTKYPGMIHNPYLALL